MICAVADDQVISVSLCELTQVKVKPWKHMITFSKTN